MSGPVTEIAYLPLIPGLDLSSGEHKKLLDGFLGTIAAQQGCRLIYWGTQVEHPDILELAIDWDGFESHKAFMDSDAYGPFLESIKPVLSGPPKLYHVRFPTDTPVSIPASQPITECLSLYFAPDYDITKYETNWQTFKEEGTKIPNIEAKGITGGWGIEEQKHAQLGKDGEEGPAKLYAAFIGWPTLEAHLEFRKTPEFPGLIKYLRDGPAVAEVHHVRFQKH